MKIHRVTQVHIAQPMGAYQHTNNADYEFLRMNYVSSRKSVSKESNRIRKEKHTRGIFDQQSNFGENDIVLGK